MLQKIMFFYFYKNGENFYKISQKIMIDYD